MLHWRHRRSTRVPIRHTRRANPASLGGSLGSAFIFVLPSVIAMTVFVVLPLVQVLRYSFMRSNGVDPPTPVGWSNYEYLFSNPDFRRIILNTALLTLGIGLWTLVPFLLAITIYGLPGADLTRTILLLPALLSPVLVGGIFRVLLANRGPLNSLLDGFGLSFLAGHWLTNEQLVLPAIIVTITWALTGVGVMLYSAGLANVAQSQVDAARVDGAGWVQLVRYVYAPALRPVTRFWVLLLTISTVTNLFSWIFALTQGGPGIASTTIDFYLYQTTVSGTSYGLGSAIAVMIILFVCVLVMVQLLYRILRPIRYA